MGISTDAPGPVKSPKPKGKKGKQLSALRCIQSYKRLFISFNILLQARKYVFSRSHKLARPWSVSQTVRASGFYRLSVVLISPRQSILESSKILLLAVMVTRDNSGRLIDTLPRRKPKKWWSEPVLWLSLRQEASPPVFVGKSRALKLQITELSPRSFLPVAPGFLLSLSLSLPPCVFK